MDGKFIELRLKDQRDIYIDKKAWGKGAGRNMDSNNDEARRRFKVTKVGDHKMELELLDGRVIFIHKDGWISCERSDASTRTSEKRR